MLRVGLGLPVQDLGFLSPKPDQSPYRELGLKGSGV